MFPGRNRVVCCRLNFFRLPELSNSHPRYLRRWEHPILSTPGQHSRRNENVPIKGRHISPYTLHPSQHIANPSPLGSPACCRNCFPILSQNSADQPAECRQDRTLFHQQHRQDRHLHSKNWQKRICLMRGWVPKCCTLAFPTLKIPTGSFSLCTESLRIWHLWESQISCADAAVFFHHPAKDKLHL